MNIYIYIYCASAKKNLCIPNVASTAVSILDQICSLSLMNATMMYMIVIHILL